MIWRKPRLLSSDKNLLGVFNRLMRHFQRTIEVREGVFPAPSLPNGTIVKTDPGQAYSAVPALDDSMTRHHSGVVNQTYPGMPGRGIVRTEGPTDVLLDAASDDQPPEPGSIIRLSKDEAGKGTSVPNTPSDIWVGECVDARAFVPGSPDTRVCKVILRDRYLLPE